MANVTRGDLSVGSAGLVACPPGAVRRRLLYGVHARFPDDRNGTGQGQGQALPIQSKWR